MRPQCPAKVPFCSLPWFICKIEFLGLAVYIYPTTGKYLGGDATSAVADCQVSLLCDPSQGWQWSTENCFLTLPAFCRRKETPAPYPASISVCPICAHPLLSLLKSGCFRVAGDYNILLMRGGSSAIGHLFPSAFPNIYDVVGFYLYAACHLLVTCSFSLCLNKGWEPPGILSR